MVMFASLISAAVIYARVAKASPMAQYGGGYSGGASSAPAASMSMSMMSMSSAAAPAYTMASSSGSYSSGSSSGSSYNSGSGSMYGSGSSYNSGSGSMYGSGSSYSSGSSYGSGSMSSSSGYDNCVSQCVAQYGTPPSMSSSGSYSSGSGATHTVWVAPTQGVLRYVPFAVNASVGDTIKFVWGANVHTVTKSSALDICNKTANAPFASGSQNKTFVFTQVVNDTNPTFFYCGTPNHCEKGMFGIINPPNAYGSSGSAMNMISSVASMNPSTQTAYSFATNATSNCTTASSWGMSMNISQLPSWAQSYAVENMFYTQSVIAMNKEVITTSGSLDFGLLGNGMPVAYPDDVAGKARASTDGGYGSGSSSSSSSAAASSPSSTGGASPQTNSKSGAGALSSPRVAVALVAVVAAWFAL